MLVLIYSVYTMQDVYFYETVSPKNHGQVCMDRKFYQDALLVSFTANPPSITTANHTDEKISFPLSKLRHVLPANLRYLWCFIPENS